MNYNYWRDGYEAATGRYTQADPAGLSGGINSFAYVFSNPLNSIDPNGLSALTIPWWVEAQAQAVGGTCAVTTVGAIGVGVTLMAMPNSTSARDTVKKPQSCNDGNADCQRLAAQMSAHAEGVRRKWDDLATDPRNLFNLAHSRNPGGESCERV